MIGHGWKTTIELNVGDLIETDTRKPISAYAVINQQRQSLTYNFTVADFHTHYVTEQKVLVHNCDVTKSADKFSRLPKSIQDQMTLEAAKDGQGDIIIKNLNAPQNKEKMSFKFKKHSTEGMKPWGNDPAVPPGY